MTIPRFAGWGLRAILSHDMSYKFRDQATPPNRVPRNLPARNTLDCWLTVGFFDFLTITPFDALDEVMLQGHREPLASWRQFRELVLLATEERAKIDRLVKDVTDPGAADPPLLVLTMITMSPLLYEYLGMYDDLGFSAVHQAFDQVIRVFRCWISANCPDLPLAFFGCLSSPDVVIVATPRTPQELHQIHLLACRAQMLSMEEVRRCRLLAPEELRKLKSRCGHAFVEVRNILSLRRKAKATFEQQAFRKAEDDVGLRIPFQLRVDCGHETKLARFLHRHSPNYRPPATTRGCHTAGLTTPWNDHAVSGEFTHLEDLYLALENRWLWPPWRQRHLLDSTSTVLFSSDSDPGPAWWHGDYCWMNPDVATTLKTISDQLDHFAEQFLNDCESRELKSLFNRFRASFFRHDLLSISGDLLPFFRQLGAAFSLTPQWKDYLYPGTTADSSLRYEAIARQQQFSEELHVLLAHVGRALSNRIEQRSVLSDPPARQTFRYGGCKLLGAYTALFWLCWELFRRDPTVRQDEQAYTGEFAACLSSGTQGRTLIREIFAGFRIHFEDKLKNDARLQARWPSRLILLDISGPDLLRPSTCFVHCLHEAAEDSEWINEDRCKDLRAALNRWILEEAGWILTEGMARHLKELGQYPAVDSQNMAECPYRHFAHYLTRYCAFRHHVRREAQEDRDIKEREREVLHQQNPPDFALWLGEAIARYGCEPGLESKIASLYPPYSDPNRQIGPKVELRPIGVEQYAAVAGSDRLQAALANLASFANEVTADSAMWMSFSHIREGVSEDGARDEQNRLEDLAQIFVGLLRTSREVMGKQALAFQGVTLLQRSLLYRWAIQAAANSDTWQQDLTQRLRTLVAGGPAGQVQLNVGWCVAYLTGVASHASQFATDRKSLCQSLAEFRAYGGQNAAEPLFFPAICDFPPAERQLFRGFVRAWETRNSGNQQQLVMDFWAMSQVLSRQRMLKKGPQGVDDCG